MAETEQANAIPKIIQTKDNRISWTDYGNKAT